MVDPSSCPPPERLRQLLDSNAQADWQTGEQEQLIAHLDGCSACQRQLESLAGGNPALIAAARTLQLGVYANETSLRRVINRLGSDSNLTMLYSMHSQPDRSTLPRSEEALKALGQLDAYEVTDLLGVGGMAVVFKAFDRALKRWVAIKVLAPDLASDPVAWKRFAREAQAAAALRHEHVITIHAVSEVNGLPFLVMEYAEGGSLQDYLDKHGPPDLPRAIRLAAEIASALAVAHALGLVHRDIKPSNILLAKSMESERASVDTMLHAPDPLVPKISDFGLVCVADEVRLTRTGIITGTPMYMAPEQALCEPLDGRADLFSLGSLLYTLCTGQEPFVTGSPLGVLRQVCDVTPRPIRELNPDIPNWLDAIFQRLHAKRPADRFATASEVADLLWYNLEHPDQPRQVPQLQPAGRPRPKRRRVLARVLLGALVLICGLVLSETLHWTHLLGPAGSSSTEQSQVTLRTELRGHQGPVLSVAYAPDARTVATGSDDGVIRLWDAHTGQEKTSFSLPAQRHAISTVVFAHSGKFLGSVDGTGAMHVWDITTGKEGPELPPHSGSSRRMAISPDDETLAIGSSQNVELWDLKSREVKILSGHQNTVLAFAFAPDGRTLATGDVGGHILLWDPATGSKLGEFQGDSVGMRALAFTPDGQKLVSAGTGDKDVKLWEARTHELLATLSGYENAVLNLAVSPHSRLLATASRDGTVKLWSIADTQLLATLQAHRGSAAVAFSPGGRTLATVGEDGLGKLWNLGSLADTAP